MKRLNKRGVSLAELLAVVVIMGIIAAIAIPLVGNVIETSKRKAFLGDLVTVVEAARTYCAAEGKDEADSMCEISEKAVDILGNSNGIMDNYGPGVNVTTMKNFDKYLSKPITDIADKIYIITNGKVYYIRTESKKGDYTTTEAEYATNSLKPGAGINDLVLKSKECYIDPTHEKAFEYIGIAKGGE